MEWWFSGSGGVWLNEQTTASRYEENSERKERLLSVGLPVCWSAGRIELVYEDAETPASFGCFRCL